MIYIGINPREMVPFEEIGSFERQPWKQIFKLEVQWLLRGEFVSCFNQNHHIILRRLKKRLEIDIPLPYVAGRHHLKLGDKVILVIISNIHSIKYEGERYTEEDVRKARISYRLYTIQH